jgi:3-hydroxymyristoyl/3-hydroxydecanoyl-(acyl carrier protein) dehydratase
MNVAPLINIIEKQRQAASLSVRAIVPEDLWCFPDHFPNQPIVPGYLHLVWLSEILKEFFPEASSPRTINKIKYHAPLHPGQEFLLQANWTCATRALSFTITSCDKKMSSGQYCY